MPRRWPATSRLTVVDEQALRVRIDLPGYARRQRRRVNQCSLGAAPSSSPVLVTRMHRGKSDNTPAIGCGIRRTASTISACGVCWIRPGRQESPPLRSRIASSRARPSTAPRRADDGRPLAETAVTSTGCAGIGSIYPETRVVDCALEQRPPVGQTTRPGGTVAWTVDQPPECRRSYGVWAGIHRMMTVQPHSRQRDLATIRSC